MRVTDPDGELEWVEGKGTCFTPDDPPLIRCDQASCPAEFFFVPGRQFPRLCLDHAEQEKRARAKRAVGPVRSFRCRDIGYGIETGKVMAIPLDGPDWTGKRPYRLVDSETVVYLFDDELWTS